MLSQSNFIYVWIEIAIITFFYLLFFKTAPYGRHSSTNWGPMINNKLGWFLMEFPALFGFLFFYFKNQTSSNNIVYIFIFFWCIHYVNRTLIFPLRLKTKDKKMPLIIVLSGFCFNLVNTYLIADYLVKNANVYPNSWLSSWQMILGITLFIIGYFINQYSDYLLLKLRADGSTGYKIPKGFLFNYVSCPNLLGEIIEWTGFALMTWCLPSASFLIWTMANLIPRAISHHKWYLNYFENYPKNRKAIFPFIW